MITVLPKKTQTISSLSQQASIKVLPKKTATAPAIETKRQVSQPVQTVSKASNIDSALNEQLIKRGVSQEDINKEFSAPTAGEILSSETKNIINSTKNFIVDQYTKTKESVPFIGESFKELVTKPKETAKATGQWWTGLATNLGKSTINILEMAQEMQPTYNVKAFEDIKNKTRQTLQTAEELITPPEQKTMAGKIAQGGGLVTADFIKFATLDKIMGAIVGAGNIKEASEAKKILTNIGSFVGVGQLDYEPGEESRYQQALTDAGMALAFEGVLRGIKGLSGETKKTLSKIVSKEPIKINEVENLVKDIDKNLVDDAYKSTIKNGGVTINLEGNKPTKGYAYSPYKDAEMIIPKEEFTPVHIDNFAKMNYTRLSEPGNHVGIWEDNGKIYLDISKVGEASEKTILDAEKAGQLGVFDLENFKTINTKLYEETNRVNLNAGKNGGTNIEGNAGGVSKVSESISEKTIKPATTEATSEAGFNIQKKEVTQVPRGQLPVGEGDVKLSRLESRIKDTLDKLPEADRLNLSTYQQMNKADQIKQATEYVLKNPDEAMEVLKGIKPAPKGLLYNSIALAMEENSKGNADLAIKLASLRSTRAGQEISILTERDPHSPVKYISNLVNNRVEAIGGREKIKELINKEIGEGKKVLKKSNLATTDWNSFIDSIKC